MISLKFSAKYIDRNLFVLQAAILFVYSITLSLSNTLIYQNFSSGILWKHWIGYASWVVSVYFLNKVIEKRTKNSQSFLLPIATMLTGIGVMTIWRLSSDFGFRQSIIFGFISLFLTWLLSDENNVRLFTRNFYLFLGAGLILSLATIFLGTNPSGFGPKLWLGCCGIYLQPSEPLKLIFIFFISFYLPKTTGKNGSLLFFLLVLGLTFLILLAQRDLGTSSIFVLILSTLVYLHTRKIRILFFSMVFLVFTGIIAFFTIDLIQLRILTWLNPWEDPTNSSYQIVQALITIANGGINGRGPGIGFPTLVPIAHSDFIFTSIAEELGMLGSVAVLLLFSFLAFEGLMIAKRMDDPQKKMLAAGITIYLCAQSIVIIGGNIKLLPLTGVTLPFLSYGGSSLFTSFIAIIVLRILGESTNSYVKRQFVNDRTESILLVGLLAGFATCALALGWWGIYRSDELLNRTDNPRRSISDYYVLRGSILDRNNDPLTITEGSPGSYFRHYLYPELSPILGYTHPMYGQVGIESSYDDQLRGQKGYSDLVLWWNHLIYGRPPTGLNIRTSLDSNFEKRLATSFEGKIGSGLVINATSGEILAAVSSPYFDANHLEDLSGVISQDNAPLINRISQGEYPIRLIEPELMELIKLQGESSNEGARTNYLSEIGFFIEPFLGFELKNKPSEPDNFVSPIQTAKLMSSISNKGKCTGLKFVTAVHSPQENWIILPDPDMPSDCFTIQTTSVYSQNNVNKSHLFWSVSNYDPNSHMMVYLAGTLPDWKGTPLTMVVFLEEQFDANFKQNWDGFFETLVLQK